MPSLCASPSHESNGLLGSWLDLKEVPQMKGTSRSPSSPTPTLYSILMGREEVRDRRNSKPERI